MNDPVAVSRIGAKSSKVGRFAAPQRERRKRDLAEALPAFLTPVVEAPCEDDSCTAPPAELPSVVESMTDARFPDRWLGDVRVQSLSDPGYRLFGNALMWSVLNRTDGKIPEKHLRMIPFCNPAYVTELVECGVWKKQRDGWLIVEFKKTQSSSDELDQLERIRKAERDKKRRQRANDAAGVPGTVPGTSQARTELREEGKNYPANSDDEMPPDRASRLDALARARTERGWEA